MDRVRCLASAIRRRQDDVARAISRDFGNRSVYETKLAEVLMLLDNIKYLRRHLGAWMRPQRRRVSMTYMPATAGVRMQPLGVMGVIAPWNYPLELAPRPTAVPLAPGTPRPLHPP